MGASGTKTHEAFTVAPATATAGSPPDGVDEPLPGIEAGSGNALLAAIGDAETFAGLCAATSQATPLFPGELPGGWPAPDEVHAAAKAWLDTQPAEDLYQWAAAAGLDHAGELSRGAVAHWLDPSYHPDAPSKLAIAAKALDRHLAKIADGTVIDPPSEPSPGSWAATPAEVLDAQSAFTSALGAMPVPPQAQWYKPPPADPAPLAALLAAETHLATAHCPELADSHAAACAAAKAAVDTAIGTHHAAARQLVHAGVAAGDIDEATARTLSPADVLALRRATTPAATVAELHDAVETRNTQLAVEAAAHAGVTGLHGSLDAASIGAFAADAATYRATRAQIAAWRNHAAIPATAPSYLGDDQLAASFRSAAKPAPIGELRAGAIAMGLDKTAAATASRAQLQNWALAAWHPDHNQAAIAAAMASKPAPPSPATSAAAVGGSAQATSSSSSSSGSSTSATTGSVTAGSGRWHARHAQLVAGLKHHAATLNDLPARPDPAAVAAWTFDTGPAVHLGGMHAKSVHTAPDGSTWMFKPDKHGGARACAEASANRILHRAGIPTIPVYERRLGNQPGTIQPLLTGASQLSSSPSAWSQADVDAIVRYHTAAWVVGDHDAKHDNLLRTPGGGLVPIDHGQAFKFYGRDKLSSSYHPNGSFGAKPPVWHQLYEAHRSGGLAPGVTVRPHVALPVIKAFEAMPDHEFASLLRPTATAGATNPAIHWRDTMTKRAATATGHAHPSAAQIADAFVAHGLDRKHGLRAAFASLFAAEKIAGADLVTKTT